MSDRLATFNNEHKEAEKIRRTIGNGRTLLPQSHELPAPPPHFCGGAAQLPRFAVAPGGIWHLLPLRAVGRIVRPHARALAQYERRAYLLHRGAVRAGVQRGQRNVSQVFQDFRHREISCGSARTAQEGLGKKYVNEPALWLKTEDMVRKVLIESRINYVEVANEAAFYGPKIDVQVWSVIGREFTLATNQVDFAVPAKIRPDLSRQGQHRQNAALHPSRPAGHARAFHRFPHRALRRQFPLVARPGTGARPDHRRRRPAGRLRQVNHQPNCAPSRSAPKAISAPTKSTAKSSAPRKPKSTPCW